MGKKLIQALSCGVLLTCTATSCGSLVLLTTPGFRAAFVTPSLLVPTEGLVISLKDSLSASQFSGQPLGEINLKSILRGFDTTSLGSLQLQVKVIHDDQPEPLVVALDPKQAQTGQDLLLKDIPLALRPTLRLELFDPVKQQVIDSQEIQALEVTPGTPRQVTLSLEKLAIPIFTSTSDGGRKASLPTAATGAPNPASPPTPTTALLTSNGGGGSDGSTPNPLSIKNLRLLESGQTSLTFVWEAPPGAKGYRIYRDGKLVAENHPVANYNLTGLFSQTEYTIEVSAITEQGDTPKVPLKAKTGQGLSSSGGGGGGGGGGTPPPAPPPAPPNPAPVIQSLTPSQTTLNGRGYPTELKATATDDAPLLNSAYTWSCDAPCGDASFSPANGPNVVWTAPSNAANGSTYTLRLQVSDGVNPPVEQVQVITVNHTVADVVFTGGQK